ncbi:alkaline phosphatase family protein [Actinomycetaceae bacterium TAE3-ERU4]|nr:alkaline phosphatase family protein [Actinomycetaceae bacterium TAE3-ERU4]
MMLETRRGSQELIEKLPQKIKDAFFREKFLSVSVIMVDGLGYQLIEKYRAYARNLWGMIKDTQPAISTSPSTTATAITASMTGALPGVSNMLGYSVYSQGKSFNLLDFKGSNVNPKLWQPCQTIFEELKENQIPSRVFLPRKYEASGLTTAALRGGTFYPADTYQQLSNLLDSIDISRGFNYLYWNQVDSAGHRYGVGSQPWLDALEATDYEISNLVSRHGKKTKFFLLADHGMLNSNQNNQFDLALSSDLAPLIKNIAGEPRALQIHLQEIDTETAADRFSEILGEYAVVYSGNELEQLYGGPNEHLGQIVAFAKEDATIVDSRYHSETLRLLPGVHGSLTPVEMQIPFAWIG